MTYIIATHNADKLKELKRILKPLGIEAVTDRDLGLSLPEVDEIGTTFAENAFLKADSACRFTGLPAIADDSGLAVDALNGAPGVYSARYAGRHADTVANNAKLLEVLRDVPQAARTARYFCAVCCVFPDGSEPLTTQGIMEGYIGMKERGRGGFGYDPLFVLPDGRTAAELTDKEKDAVSHRGNALRLFREQLMKRLGGTDDDK